MYNRLRGVLPNIRPSDYTLVDHPAGYYNCVGWSLNDFRWWEPGEDYYWPNDRLGDYALSAYQAMYKSQGF